MLYQINDFDFDFDFDFDLINSIQYKHNYGESGGLWTFSKSGTNITKPENNRQHKITRG